MIRILFIFIASLLICSCNMGKHRLANKIVYKVFDSLDNYLCEKIGNNKNTAIIITESTIWCHHRPNRHNGLNFFELEVTDYKYDIEAKMGGRSLRHTVKHSNRYMQVCGKLYPVYFDVIDRYFLDPYDSAHIAGYREFGRPLLKHNGLAICVDMDQAVFYP